MTLLRGKSGDAAASEPGERRIDYQDDTYGWALQQAAFLRAGRTDKLDLVNLADEIADLAARDYDKLESALSRVIQHLLKWDYQPERRCRSWVLTIREHRRRTARLLLKHPGLKNTLPTALLDGFEDARDRALDETGLPEAVLPRTCPYVWEDVVSRDITWPEHGSDGDHG